MENKELTPEVLEMVSGGTPEENAELIEALKANKKLSVTWQSYQRKFKGKDDLALSYLIADYLHIYTRASNKFENMYYREEQDFTHAQILEMIRNY